MPQAVATVPAWPRAIYQVLREHGISVFGFVPDGGHKALIELAQADADVHAVSLTTEEEGVGLIAGCDLAWGRATLLLQSSGVGNIVNHLSLVKAGRFPMLLLVAMRGQYGEGNPWQFPMGEAVVPVLDAMGVMTLSIERPEEAASTVDAAATMVFQGGRAVAVLLTPQLIGPKKF